MKSINSAFDSENTVLLPLKQAEDRGTAGEGSQCFFMLQTCGFYSALTTLRLKCSLGVREASELHSLPRLHVAPPQGKTDCHKGRTLLEAGFFSLQGKVEPKPSPLNNDFMDIHQENHISECSNTFILHMGTMIWLWLAHFNFLLQLFFAPTG